MVGQEGDTCEQCGSVLATDQRYCVNCGRRRGESRVDYETRLNTGHQPAERGGGGIAGAAQPAVDPAFAILAIALLGVMLLLGVLIGKKGNNNTQTVATQAAPTTTAAAATPTNTTATTASNNKAAKGGGGGGTAPGAGKVVQGGSGSTSRHSDRQHRRLGAAERQERAGRGGDAGQACPPRSQRTGRRRQRRDLHRVLTMAQAKKPAMKKPGFLETLRHLANLLRRSSSLPASAPRARAVSVRRSPRRPLERGIGNRNAGGPARAARAA